MKNYKATATLADSKKCSALVALSRSMMSQDKREALAISTARTAGAKSTVLDADLEFALGGCTDKVQFLNRVLNLAHPDNRHVVKAALADALDAQYVAETPVLVRAVETVISLGEMFKAMREDKKAFAARMAAGKAAAKAMRLAAQ